jgi:hypothetical protein
VFQRLEDRIGTTGLSTCAWGSVIEGRGGVLETRAELVARVDVVLFVEAFDVAVDGGVTDSEGLRDVVVALAFEEEVLDLLAAFAGFAEEGGAVGAFAGLFVPGGGWDFVAVEEAGGDVGDEVVPGVAGEAGVVLDVVAGVAGEGGGECGMGSDE